MPCDTDCSGRTPLFYALENTCDEQQAVKLLLDARSPLIPSEDYHNPDVLHALLKAATKRSGDGALMLWRIVDWFLSKGADLHRRRLVKVKDHIPSTPSYLQLPSWPGALESKSHNTHHPCGMHRME